MKLLKKNLALLLAAALCLSLTACGNSNNQGNQDKQDKQDVEADAGGSGWHNNGDISDISDYVGLWEYADENVWLRI